MTTTTEQKISWTRGESLGSGAFCAVHVAQVTYIDTGLRALMAVKSAEVEHASPLKKEKEWMVQSNFGDCPHLLHCLGDDYTQENGKELYNVLIDYCPRGSIADLIQKTLDMDEDVSEETASRYAKSVLLGLKFLHESNIIHRNIKPSNLLLDNKGDVKIADFGLAKRWTKESESKRCKSRKGTINYMAPETVKEKIYGKGVDIWALGCTVVELILGAPLFVGEEDEIMSELRKLHGLPNVDPCAEMTNTAVDFLKKCMYVDPTERWTAQMLLKHPFITGQEEDPKSSSSCPAEDDIMAFNSPIREIVDFLLADTNS